MLLKMLANLDIPLTSLHTKNYYPRLNGLGDMAIVVYKVPIPFFGIPCCKSVKL